MQVINDKQIRARAPAVFTEAHNRTDAYAQIPTSRIVNRLADVGYRPVAAGQDNPRSRDPRLVTHVVTLQHEKHISKGSGGLTEVPQITLVNSHNGRNKLRMYAGFFRIICLNGLVVGSPAYTAAVAHRGDALVESLAFAEEMTDALGKLQGVIDRWSSIELTDAQAQRFAKEAAALRFGKAGENYAAADILATRREADEGRSLWSVFNRVQENTVQGGLRGINRATDRRTSSGGLTAIGSNISYNRSLWNAAEAFAEVA